MIRTNFLLLGLQGIQSLIRSSDDPDPKPLHNVLLAKWEDHHDRHPCDAYRQRRSNSLRYLTPAD
jgi:hypothetical protein